MEVQSTGDKYMTDTINAAHKPLRLDQQDNALLQKEEEDILAQYGSWEEYELQTDFEAVTGIPWSLMRHHYPPHGEEKTYFKYMVCFLRKFCRESWARWNDGARHLMARTQEFRTWAPLRRQSDSSKVLLC